MKKRRKINFALVEKKRPPVYRAMKYWGKKPHNIWRKYIETYTSKDGVYLDPFVGSAISAFEAVKVNRRAIAFDLNPLTSFLIEVLSSSFSEDIFRDKVIAILKEVSGDNIYKKFFQTKCPVCDMKTAIAQHFKWEGGSIYEVGVECLRCGSNKKRRKGKVKHEPLGTFYRSLKAPDKRDSTKAEKMDKININYWYPDESFHDSPSFSANFIECIGGNSYADLWTKRNLYVLAKIFNLILKEENEELKKQLLFGFIQTIHLCTKMSVPRRPSAKRLFSTSWGRSAYICASRQMEMNPLLVFESNCLKKQSVVSALSNAIDYFGKKPKLLYVDESNKSNRSQNFDIKYGIIDINNLTDYVDTESVDFIMTDPPYGGLVQYLDLSSIWLMWLKRYDLRFEPNYDAEITIKNEKIDIVVYKRKFLNGLKQLYKVLKPDGFIVFTFHNKEIKIWNIFLKSLSLAGFKVERVIHQQNRRTGESNVANPYGTSATDFYIRCIKSPYTELKTNKGEFEHFVVTTAIEIIAQRNEPTPYQFLFNGLLPEISRAGFDLEDFDESIKDILSKHVGDIFMLTENKKNGAGTLWWFVNPDEHIKYRDKKLSDRVEESIVSLLRRKVSVTFDEVLAEIFIRYPNGLTPDIRSMDKVLKKYATKSGGKWLYKGEEIENEFTDHTRILFLLNSIGRKIGFKTFIGKREQSEKYKGKKLSAYSNFQKLNFLKNYSKEKLERIKMVDMLWLKNKKVEYIIEVENTTNFTSGIQRGSNLKESVYKIMILPKSRQKELENTTDPLFLESFTKYNWSYMFYHEVEKLNSLQHISESAISKYLKKID